MPGTRRETLLTDEQTATLQTLTQRERVDMVLNALIRRLEKDQRCKVLREALSIVGASTTKAEAVTSLQKVLDRA